MNTWIWLLPEGERWEGGGERWEGELQEVLPPVSVLNKVSEAPQVSFNLTAVGAGQAAPPPPNGPILPWPTIPQTSPLSPHHPYIRIKGLDVCLSQPLPHIKWTPPDLPTSL